MRGLPPSFLERRLPIGWLGRLDESKAWQIGNLGGRRG